MTKDELKEIKIELAANKVRELIESGNVHIVFRAPYFITMDEDGEALIWMKRPEPSIDRKLWMPSEPKVRYYRISVLDNYMSTSMWQDSIMMIVS